MSTKNSSVSSVSASVAHTVDNSPTGVVNPDAKLTLADIAGGVRREITMSDVAATNAGYVSGWNETLTNAAVVGNKAGKGDAKKALLSQIRAITAENLKALALTSK